MLLTNLYSHLDDNQGASLNVPGNLTTNRAPIFHGKNLLLFLFLLFPITTPTNINHTIFNSAFYISGQKQHRSRCTVIQNSATLRTLCSIHAIPTTTHLFVWYYPSYCIQITYIIMLLLCFIYVISFQHSHYWRRHYIYFATLRPYKVIQLNMTTT